MGLCFAPAVAYDVLNLYVAGGGLFEWRWLRQLRWLRGYEVRDCGSVKVLQAGEPLVSASASASGCEIDLRD